MIRAILFIISVPAFLLGIAMLIRAENVMQEIEAFSCFNVAVVSFGCAAIVDAIVSLKKEIKKSGGKE